MTIGVLLLTAAARAQDPGTLTLDRAVALALEHHPGLTIALAGLDEARADQGITRSRVLPRVSATASVVYLEPDRLSPISLSTPTGAPTLYAEEQYAGLTARQLLFDGSVLPSLRSAGVGVDAAELGVTTAEAETRFAATLAFVRLLEAEATVGVAEDAVERQAAFEALVSRLGEVDKATRLDLLKARAQRLEAERVLVGADETRGLAEVRLRSALGVAADFPLVLEGELGRELEPSPAEAALYADVASHSPALAAQTARAKQAGLGVRAAWGEHLPDLSLAASYGYRNRDVGGGADEYVVGASLEWPLFSGLAIDRQVDRSRAKQVAAEAATVALEDQVRVDVRPARAARRTAVATVQAAKGTVEVDQEAVEASAALFEAGEATTLDVLTSQADLARAEGALVQAYGDYAVARASVERLTGRAP